MNPPKSVPQVAEAKAEAELTVALRTAFHDTKPDQADFAMPAIRQRKRSMAGLSAASSCQRGTGEDAGYQETVATNTSVATSGDFIRCAVACGLWFRDWRPYDSILAKHGFMAPGI